MNSTLSRERQKNFPTFKHWRVEYSPDQTVWLGLDKQDATTNVLSREVLTEFEAIIDHLAAEPPGGLVLHSLKANGFISGADINEFPEIIKEDDVSELISRGQRMLDRLESLPCTSVAMIDGYALGGGLEFAMACDVRVVAEEDNRTLSLPEIQLGLHPGFGGTIRTIQLCGVLQAMPMILSGSPVTPAKARRMGLVDKVVDRSRLEETAAKLARRPSRPRKRALLDRLLHLDVIRPLIARRLRAGVAARARREHYPAPYAVIDLWEKHAALSPAAYAAEAGSFARLLDTDTSKNLVRVYFLQERLKQSADYAIRARTTARSGHLHVVGAGIMGGDIAAWAALQGLTGDTAGP